jgi:hypothetical protein
MKPSEALDKGKDVLPFARGNFFSMEDGETLCACPLGMMLIGAGMWHDPHDWSVLDLILDSNDTILDRFPDLDATVEPRCACQRVQDEYLNGTRFIGHMVDYHDWGVDEVMYWLKERGL